MMIGGPECGEEKPERDLYASDFEAGTRQQDTVSGGWGQGKWQNCTTSGPLITLLHSVRRTSGASIVASVATGGVAVLTDNRSW